MNKKIVQFVMSCILLGVTVVTVAITSYAAEPLKTFTAEELSTFNGQGGQPAYFAYKGKVYDVTGSDEWTNGNHYGLMAGKDLTSESGSSPHGDEVLNNLPVVGIYSPATSAKPVVSAQPEAERTVDKKIAEEPELGLNSSKSQTDEVSSVWYQNELTVFGLSLVTWTGIGFAVTLALHFVTSSELPWGQLWTKSKKPLSQTEAVDTTVDTSSSFGRYLPSIFAWAALVMGVMYAVMIMMQFLGYSL